MHHSGSVPIYCVFNESDLTVAEAEGRTPYPCALHRTAEGAINALPAWRYVYPDDSLGIRVMHLTPEELAHPKLILDE